MDKHDKETLVNILTGVGLFLMILVIIVIFISWDYSWFSFRMFVVGAMFYLAAYYMHRTIKE